MSSTTHISRASARRRPGSAKPRGPRLALALASTVLAGTLGSIFLWVPSVAAELQCGGGDTVGSAGVDSAGSHPVSCAAAADAPASSSAPADVIAGAPHRLVAVPDLHGDLRHARASLRLAG